MSTVLVKRLCPKCNNELEYNFAYGVDECFECGYTIGSSD